ncbi:hypothetical protein U4E84_03580 [Halorubrum sp. AD140]|uniref:hypothetical protein n=1 Tax=Halorubrum sp. AD140 TaxID=3050073 RepID=UPI002ACC9AD2|nr:hypothetical protein [Halorubrum sp. AD140]MDZ5810433.1 hypothetical protein [Halorubrum sp. AD140]
MELSRRGILGGVGAALAVGAVGFAGATAVADGDALDGGPGSDGGGPGDEAVGEADDGDEADGAVDADPDAPFEARLLRDGDDDRGLFDASDLDRVEGVREEGDEHLVYAALGDDGVDAFQGELEASGVADEPGRFVVSMALDGTEVRRVELDESTVAALTDEEWGGVLTLPFDERRVAESVYESLADA